MYNIIIYIIIVIMTVAYFDEKIFFAYHSLRNATLLHNIQSHNKICIVLRVMPLAHIVRALDLRVQRRFSPTTQLVLAFFCSNFRPFIVYTFIFMYRSSKHQGQLQRRAFTTVHKKKKKKKRIAAIKPPTQLSPSFTDASSSIYDYPNIHVRISDYFSE